MGIMFKSACMDVNPITGNRYNLLFNCMMVGQASDTITNLT